MFFLELLFCFSSFVGLYFFSYTLGRKGTIWYVCLNMFFSFFSALLIFLYGIYSGLVVQYRYFEWICLGPTHVYFGFTVDSLGYTTALVVVFISFLIHLYSVSYMGQDPYFSRFMAFLSLFSFFMVLLVISDNFLQFFLAWEGVGICSYLLISFWYTRLSALRAALEAIAFNRVGDFGLLFAIVLIIAYVRSVDFSVVFSMSPILVKLEYCVTFFSYSFSVVDVIGLLLLLGVIAKSAQLSLHVWLPDAMEGPTPVSALLHSSTMVVAGVFLLLRCSPFFEYSYFTLNCAVLIGSLTAFFAASVGLVQHDLKKVIAYSTCSQLGYMVFACGMSAYHVAFYHIFNHAFFKSLLFLGAGSVIHSLLDEQDMRRMGGLVFVLPLTYTVMLIGSLSLAGMPFLSGYYSKDAIIETASVGSGVLNWFCINLSVLAAFLTAFYSFRLLYLTFLSVPRTSFYVFQLVHESDWFMSLPLIILAFFSIFSGYLFRDLFVGFGTLFWLNSLFILPFGYINCYEYIPFYYKFLPIFFSFFGILCSYLIYSVFYARFLQFLFLNLEFYGFFSKKWYFDTLWFQFANFVLKFSYYVPFWTIDQGWLQIFGPGGIKRFFGTLVTFLYFVQSGFLFHYIFIFVFSILAFVLFGFDFSFFREFVLLSLVFLFFLEKK